MLTTTDLQAEVPSEIWSKIVQGDNALGDKFLNKARAWLLARLRPCQVSAIDEDDQIVRLILVNRALYEMYAYVEKEDLAFDKKETAEELLIAVYGVCVKGVQPEDTPKAGIPVGVVVAGADNWEGFA